MIIHECSVMLLRGQATPDHRDALQMGGCTVFAQVPPNGLVGNCSSDMHMCMICLPCCGVDVVNSASRSFIACVGCQVVCTWTVMDPVVCCSVK